MYEIKEHKREGHDTHTALICKREATNLRNTEKENFSLNLNKNFKMRN